MTDLDPLLKDLSERKQSVRRNVLNLASELKDARTRLTLQEESFNRESSTRKVVEMKAKRMEDEIARLHRGLEERDGLLEASISASEQYIKELDALRSQLSVSRATAEASAASAESAQLQCVALLKELDEKNISIKEHEVQVNRLADQLDLLQKDLQAREVSQSQLKDEVLRMERDIMQSIAKAGNNKDCELQKILAQVSPKNFENISKCLDTKDAEIVRLRDEIRIMSAHWKHKAQELEMQLEKQRRVDQELKKRVVKLEFCLQEARSQTRKLQRMGEGRDKALKELQDQLVVKQQNVSSSIEKQNFWESSGFKIMISMSMLVLVVFTKQ